MLPSNWFAITAFFVLLAPGVLFRILADQRRVARAESGLQETGRVILTSVCFSTLGLGASAVLAKVLPELVLPPDDIAFGTVSELRTAPGSLVGTAVSVLAFSLGAVWLFDRLLKRSQPASISSHSGWWQALRKDLPKGHYPVARIETVAGGILVGRVRSYTADFEVADRELTLVEPIYVQATSEDAPELLKEGWQRLVVNGAQVAQLAVAYAPESAVVAGPAATPAWSKTISFRRFRLTIQG